jgi:hypothetical protein
VPPRASLAEEAFLALEKGPEQPDHDPITTSLLGQFQIGAEAWHPLQKVVAKKTLLTFPDNLPITVVIRTAADVDSSMSDVTPL